MINHLNLMGNQNDHISLVADQDGAIILFLASNLVITLVSWTNQDVIEIMMAIGRLLGHGKCVLRLIMLSV